MAHGVPETGQRDFKDSHYKIIGCVLLKKKKEKKKEKEIVGKLFILGGSHPSKNLVKTNTSKQNALSSGRMYDVKLVKMVGLVLVVH